MFLSGCAHAFMHVGIKSTVQIIGCAKCKLHLPKISHINILLFIELQGNTITELGKVTIKTLYISFEHL